MANIQSTTVIKQQSLTQNSNLGENNLSNQQQSQEQNQQMQSLLKLIIELLFLPALLPIKLRERLIEELSKLIPDNQKTQWNQMKDEITEMADDPNVTKDDLIKYVDDKMNDQESLITEETKDSVTIKNSRGEDITISSKQKEELDKSPNKDAQIEAMSTDKELSEYQLELNKAEQNGASKETIEKLQKEYAETETLRGDSPQQTRQKMLEELKETNRTERDADYQKLEQKNQNLLKDGKKQSLESSINNGQQLPSKEFADLSLDRIQNAHESVSRNAQLEKDGQDFQKQLQEIQKQVQQDGMKREFSFHANNQSYNVKIEPNISENGAKSSKTSLNEQEMDTNDMIEQIKADNRNAIQDKERQINQLNQPVDQSTDKIASYQMANINLKIEEAKAPNVETREAIQGQMKENTQLIKNEIQNIYNKSMPLKDKFLANELNQLKESPFKNAMNITQQLTTQIKTQTQTFNMGR